MKIKAKLEPGKVAVVTGGSSGIGKSIALQLAERGLDVWLIAQRKDLLESTRKEVEARRKVPTQKIGIIPTDVSDWNLVRSAVKTVTETSGAPDLLFNSAGVTHPGYVQDLDINIFQWMMEVNYFGTVYMTKEVLPEMIKRKSGYIVNLCSMAGYIGVYGYSAYGGSKFAVRGFSDVLRTEMRLYNIGVSTVFPPDTQTPQLEYEAKIKPPETKAVSGKPAVISADAVAAATLQGIAAGKKLIFPNFDSQLVFRLNCMIGGILEAATDRMAEDAFKKRTSTPKNEG